jgi:hypothetical protein
MTTTLTGPQTSTGVRRTGRHVITPTLFNLLVRRIVAEDKLSQVLAERIVDQTIAFLVACARNTSTPLAPSALVDIGWHAFLLHTREYASFCQHAAGRFLHHVPLEPNDPAETGQAACHTLARTVAAVEEAGFVVDLDLWAQAPASDCTGCHNGCHDDPPPALR